MRIGVITWFVGPNYGTNLQAIALQYYLRKQGHEVNIINYEVFPTNVKREKKPFIIRCLYQPEKYAVKIAMRKYKHEIAERDKKFSNTRQKNCIFTKKIKSEDELINICNTFDLIICGSDQIWNPNWYDRFYFADYNDIKTRRISYAPSVGVNAIPDAVAQEIERSINKFEYISVRERRAAELLASYTKIKIEVVVDPTLLLNEREWKEIFPPKEKINGDYVLAFFLNDEKTHLYAAREFAKKHNYRYVLIPYKGITYLQKADMYANAGLEDLLELIRGAKYVLTDSFHITVFSIIHRKQFCTFQRFLEDSFTSQNVRVTNLLELVDLKSRLIPYKTKHIEAMKDIDYENHVSRLNDEIEKSKKFLNDKVMGYK